MLNGWTKTVKAAKQGRLTEARAREIVSEIYEKYPFDVSRVTLFNVDELTNLPREYKGSCYTMIYDQLAGPLGIPEENFIMPPTLSDDFEREARLFEEQLSARGGADLQMLGIGWNGHIGINQPGTPFESETWVSTSISWSTALTRPEVRTNGRRAASRGWRATSRS